MFIKINDIALNLELIKRLHPNSDDISDINWIKCKLNFSSSNFNFNFFLDIRTYAFDKLKLELSDFMDGKKNKVLFSTLEGNLEFSIEKQSLGGAYLNIKMNYNNIYVISKFESDFESIKSFYNSICHDLSDFPVLT